MFTIRFHLCFMMLLVLGFFSAHNSVFAQSSGLSYQAVILDPNGAQAPGHNFDNLPLSLGDIKLRFFIKNQHGDVEYREEISTKTDEYGMIATVIGIGLGNTEDDFDAIVWDGTSKTLRVDINIQNDGAGFLFLDEQPIITLPTQDRRLLIGAGSPSEPADRNAVYADTTNGTLYVFDGSDWIKYSSFVQVINGLTKDSGGTLHFGGPLTHPTVLEATELNTLAVTGLEHISLNNQHVLLATENTTGVLKTIAPNSLVQAQEAVVQALEGQNQFTTPLSPVDINKLSVYRNGVKIGFAVVDENTIELIDNVVCFAGDEIRIVQIF